jgi:predicted nucleic acid-binding protein
MTPRVMLDTGALLALERGQQSIRKVHRLAIEEGYPLVTTTPCVAEWWRKGRREKVRAAILRTLLLEPPDAHVARLAGAAIGVVAAGVVDALLMAAASLRGDTVYTSDLDDLDRLRAVFPGVELEHV